MDTLTARFGALPGGVGPPAIRGSWSMEVFVCIAAFAATPLSPTPAEAFGSYFERMVCMTTPCPTPQCRCSGESHAQPPRKAALARTLEGAMHCGFGARVWSSG